ncbi:hypothetical protein E3E22_03450 [Thermococcus sp. MV5]|uniref:hypothetical protein n=1 Tax=Thermococcus sp. MV5 TaxID=1638272 RepID=UPI0014393488|nr:hypothetical protein [Thermococcus sp. MV5]NJE25691.1 hypothetical protein [Thermococcus sp. MV5]
MYQSRRLQKIFEIQKEIMGIHPLLERVFPVVIAKAGHFLIFDVDSSERRYVFIKKEPSPVPLPEKLRAAFPLECYENRIACVVSEDAFQSLEGYVSIFHEFVHCYQWESCEQELRQNLTVAEKEVARGNYMWEINYPFPYSDPEFENTYFRFLDSLNTGDPEKVFKHREVLKQILSREDFEYMVWQEWKEGFARFIENKIRHRLALRENHNGIEKPLNRVLFYEGGARFIEFLCNQERELLTGIKAMFYKILALE